MRFCLVLLLAFAAAPALAAELPPRKAGLWELTTTYLTRPHIQPDVYRHCIDAATDREMFAPSGMLRHNACPRMDVTLDGDTTHIEAECRFATGKTARVRNVITGSFDRAYTMRRIVPLGDPPADEVEVVEARWLGPCAAEQQPGDIIAQGHTVINLRDYRRMMEPFLQLRKP